VPLSDKGLKVDILWRKASEMGRRINMWSGEREVWSSELGVGGFLLRVLGVTPAAGAIRGSILLCGLGVFAVKILTARPGGCDGPR
jgi:hypothetical protein